jgi:hypothetical protein
MKTMIVAELAILVAASACGNARGATPDAGTFAYSSRQQVQCSSVTMSVGQLSVLAECPHVDDLPLAGTCSKPGAGGEVLGQNGPAGWEGSIAAPAAWTCSWVSGGQAVNVPGATATICCVVKSQ